MALMTRRDYGFIQQQDGENIFAHFSAIETRRIQHSWQKVKRWNTGFTRLR